MSWAENPVVVCLDWGGGGMICTFPISTYYLVRYWPKGSERQAKEGQEGTTWAPSAPPSAHGAKP